MNIEFLGFSLEFILLFSSSLLVISVLLSRVSSTLGVPALLIFLVLGMLAGSEGLGKIPFDNYSIAFAIGSVCLAFIVFDGGLRTSWVSVKPILPIGISLSFFGTIITGIVTGIFAHLVLGLGLLEGLLLGGISSSTDAAAVFSILRSKGLSLKGKLKQILEFEAGSNDPVAVFFTIAMISIISSASTNAASVFWLFLKQAGIGFIFGYIGANAIRVITNRAGIEFEGLYGVLIAGFVMVLFSGTSYVGGSGFLAVYVAGLLLGKFDFLHKGSVTRFVDGVAWVSQITIFLVLGLLVFPSKILLVWKEGLLFAFFMMFIARPISVFLSAPGKTLKKEERLFVSWIGLRGAAPIILATLPWIKKLPNAEFYFDLVFFTVIISVVFQGISIPWIASKLKVTVPIDEESQADSNLGSLLPPGFISIEAVVHEGANATDKKIFELGLPPGVLLTSIKRGDRFLVPQGSTTVVTGDKVLGFARESSLEELKLIFGDTKKVVT
ncbi:MAG: potassium/proton antiporter [Bacteriovorax sp.]|jgi:cell volume regulation protein A